MFYNLPMPRLAWFTPLPPVRSGIAAYSADVLPLLASRQEIDVFVDPVAPPSSSALATPIRPSHEFVWRHDARPYDMVIYQLGNATCHDYMWAYLVRYPGLVVLHDAQLHHSRSRALFAAGRHDHYRQEFAFCHPDATEGVAEVVVSGHAGSLYYLWPLVGVPVTCARLVAVHSPWLAADLAERYPEQDFAVVRMGVPAGRESARNAKPVRARHGVPDGRVVFAAYGMLTPEKRLSEVLRALRSLLPYAPNVHLLLVGEPVEWYDVQAEARELGVGEHLSVTGYVPDEELGNYIDAADVCLCLRWPTSRETSAAWLRCLAAGKPTVITDLAHTSSVPAYDPRSWTVLEGAGIGSGLQPGTGRLPVCVAVDIVDEQHSLALAVRRLARDEGLRLELGRNAYEYWRREHTPEQMAEDYEAAIARALGRPVPDRAGLPAHLLPDGTALTDRIVREFGLSLDALDWV